MATHSSILVVAKSCLTLCDPWTVARQSSLSMGFSRQEYWSGLPFPSPGNFPNPGVEPRSPALADSFFTSEHVPLITSEINTNLLMAVHKIPGQKRWFSISILEISPSL